MKIRAFLFSQNNIKAIKEIIIFRVRVLTCRCSQFQQTIRRSCLSPGHFLSRRIVVKSTFIVKTPCYRRIFPTTSSLAGNPTMRIVSPRSTRRKKPQHKTMIQALARAFSSIGDYHHTLACGSTWLTFRPRPSPTRVVPLRQASLAPSFPYLKPASALFSLYCIQQPYFFGFS